MLCIHELILEQCGYCNPPADDTGSDDLNADQNFEWTLVNIAGHQLTITWCDGTVVPWSRKFTFGRFQASLMIDCADEIARFVAAPNPAGEFIGAVVRPTEAGVTTIQTFPFFTLDNGRRIDRPYIRMERSEVHWHPGIGLGRVKATAFLRFQPEIRNWVGEGN